MTRNNLTATSTAAGLDPNYVNVNVNAYPDGDWYRMMYANDQNVSNAVSIHSNIITRENLDTAIDALKFEIQHTPSPTIDMMKYDIQMLTSRIFELEQKQAILHSFSFNLFRASLASFFNFSSIIG